MCIKKEDLKFSKGKSVLTSQCTGSIFMRICWQCSSGSFGEL